MNFLVIQENDANGVFRECFCVQRALISLGQKCDVWGLNHVGWPDSPPDYNSYDAIIILENYDSGWLGLLPLRECPAVKIVWAIDSHCRGIDYYKAIFNRFQCHYCLQATKDYTTAIPNSSWFPNCFDDTLIKPLNVPKNIDAGFCGNIVNRKGWIDYLIQNISLRTDISVRGEGMVKAVNSYKIHWNKNITTDINYRNFETIGCGTLLLTDYNWQYKDLGFIHNENVVFYNSVTDCVIKTKELLGNPEELARIAQNGYELSKRHTYLERMKSLIGFLSK